MEMEFVFLNEAQEGQDSTLKQKKLRGKSVVHSSSSGQSENKLSQSTVEDFFLKQVVKKRWFIYIYLKTNCTETC